MRKYDRQYYIEITKDEERRRFSYAIAEYFKDFKGKKALDIGCGKGFLVKALRELGVDAEGIDISEYAIENAVTEYVKQSDATNLPYDDNVFDLVLCIEVLEHLEESDLNKSIMEIRRVLKPQGIIFLTTPAPGSAYAKQDPTHKSIHDKKEWIKIFLENGFTLNLKHSQGLRNTIVEYWASTNPSTVIGKFLSKFGKLRKIAISKYEERNSIVLAFTKGEE